MVDVVDDCFSCLFLTSWFLVMLPLRSFGGDLEVADCCCSLFCFVMVFVLLCEKLMQNGAVVRFMIAFLE